MSNTLNGFVRDEFKGFCEHAAGHWNVSVSCLGSVAPLLRPIHIQYLALACAATVAGQRAPRNDYAEGVIEVGQLSILLALKGLENPSQVLVRQSIEMVLKHLFFITHPIEYSWAQTRPDYRDLSFQALLEYVRRSEEYRILCDGGQVCDTLACWYGVLSRYVHVQGGSFLRYADLSSSYPRGSPDLTRLSGCTASIWPRLTLLLAIFGATRLRKASALEQKLIRKGLPAKFKHVW
jgi:hypothetical protein